MAGTITCGRSHCHSLHWYATEFDAIPLPWTTITMLDIDKWCALLWICCCRSSLAFTGSICWLAGCGKAGSASAIIHIKGHCFKVWDRGPANIVSGKLFPRFHLRQSSGLVAMTAFMAFIWAIFSNHQAIFLNSNFVFTMLECWWSAPPAMTTKCTRNDGSESTTAIRVTRDNINHHDHCPRRWWLQQHNQWHGSPLCTAIDPTTPTTASIANNQCDDDSRKRALTLQQWPLLPLPAGSQPASWLNNKVPCLSYFWLYKCITPDW